MNSSSNIDICLNVVQATVLANEINLAKNLATTSVNLTNNNSNTITQLQTELNDNKLLVKDLASKLEYLYSVLKDKKILEE